MRFRKYNAIGNDYIVLEPPAVELTEQQIRKICNRNFGVGADGILQGSEKTDGSFNLRIFNPDGSEAEKSGNGIRIFARYLWEKKKHLSKFSIITAGGRVEATVSENGKSVTVNMGRVNFQSNKIPVAGPSREVINEKMTINGKSLTYCAATIGNPHCVILCEQINPDLAKRLGSAVEIEPRFPNRTNVQFMQVIDRQNIKIEIWERGAGYTLSSGSSSCAAAASAYRLGLCDSKITVQMPGGKIGIAIGKDYSVRMTGPVAKVFEGVTSEEIFD
ncbi:MAG: diaminopimelate epimerase [Sedimentisphaerales bacterium]